MKRLVCILGLFVSFTSASAIAQTVAPEPPGAATAPANLRSQGEGIPDATPAATEPTASVAVAKARTTIAKQETKETQAALDLAKSGKLMSSGITAGVALAMQLPMPGLLSDHGQKAGDAVAMPYLMVLPFYFFTRQATREYCASAWGVGDDSEASAAAVAVSRKTAARLLDAIEADFAIGRHEADIIRTWFPDAVFPPSEPTPSDQKYDEYRYAKAIVDGVKKVFEARTKNGDGGLTAAAMDASLHDSVAYRLWNPTLRGNCGRRSFGLWIGRPLTYTATTELPIDSSRVSREVKPVVAFGVGYTPHAYLSFLAGFTYGEVELADAAGTATQRPLWASTIALGGNLDLVGSLFK